MKFFIAQAVGFVAMALGIISFQFNDREKLLTIQVFMGLSWALHFFLLGEKTGALLNIVGALRFFVYSKRNDSWKKAGFIPFVFALIFVICGIITYENWSDVMPMAAMVIASFAMWSKNTSVMRFLNLPVSAFWIIYDVISRSIPGALNETFAIVSIIVAIFRFDLKKRKNGGVMSE